MAAANWNRLIRFVALETGRIHIGEPVDPKLDVGLAFHSNPKSIKANEIAGSSALDPHARVTNHVLTVSQLLEPLAREDVGVVRGLGLNFSDHAAEIKMEQPKVPILFYKPTTSLIPSGAPIIIPRVAQPVQEHVPDYEVELVIVIGKEAKNVSVDKALDYVLGYTGANDVSFRTHQYMTTQWSFSKSFDNTNPFGPCLVSSRALQNPQDLPLKTILNGQTLQNGTTAKQIFPVAETVSFLSQGTTLYPGSIILTGTPAGVGSSKNPKIILKHGDEVKCFVGGGVGTLVNPVVEEGKASKSKL